MKIKKSNPLVTFYMFDKSSWIQQDIIESGRLNMCNVFWNLLFKLALLTIGTVLLCFLSIEGYFEPMALLVALGTALGLILFFILIASLIFGTIANSTVHDMFHAIMRNYCPQIKLED